jgi:multiple sugar transport system permease protein
MSAAPTVAPDAGVAVAQDKPKVRRRSRGGPGAEGRPGVVPTLFMLAFLVYFLFPLGWLFVASTKSLDDLFSSFGLWFADFNFIDNIKETFTKDDGVYWDWLRNTLLYSIVSAGGAALLAAAAGYGFAKFDFRGKNLLFWFVLGSVMVPTTALAIPTYLMFSKLGFTNNPLSVILPSLVSPFGIYLMRIYAEASVPSDLMEAARIDGASEVRIFLRVIIPLGLPAIASLAIFQFLWTWNDLLVALTFGQDTKPITVAIFTQLRQFGSNIELIAPAAFVSLAIPLAVFFAFQRYFVQGLLAGSVK